MRVRLCAQARCIENHVYVAICRLRGQPAVRRQRRHPLRPVGHLHALRHLVRRDGVAAECTPNIESDGDPRRGHRAAATHAASRARSRTGTIAGRTSTRCATRSREGSGSSGCVRAFVAYTRSHGRLCARVRVLALRAEVPHHRSRREPGERDPVCNGLSVRLWISRRGAPAGQRQPRAAPGRAGPHRDPDPGLSRAATRGAGPRPLPRRLRS